FCPEQTRANLSRQANPRHTFLVMTGSAGLGVEYARSSFEQHENNATSIAERLSDFCTEHSLRVAVAESLTGGRISSHLSAAQGAGQWFAGGVVAYSSDVKHRLLNVPPGPVISYQAVEMMARTTCEMMDADAAVAVSGAGG